MKRARARSGRSRWRTRQAQRKSSRPPLRFTPYAWAKLLFLRDRGLTEVGGFGVTAEADPLLVEDLRLVRQACTAVTVRFEADGYERAVMDRVVAASEANAAELEISLKSKAEKPYPLTV